MIVNINIDKSLDKAERHQEYLSDLIKKSLNNYTDHITRIEIQIKDVNGIKDGPNDTNCMIEARIKGRQPIAINNKADDIETAIKGAVDKIKSSLESVMGKIQDQ
jgi:ribosome-associated translation inhibitor RaiA